MIQLFNVILLFSKHLYQIVTACNNMPSIVLSSHRLNKKWLYLTVLEALQNFKVICSQVTEN